jgi:hypothetical protein
LFLFLFDFFLSHENGVWPAFDLINKEREKISEKLMQLHQTACRVFLMDTALSRGFTSGRLMRIGLQLLIYLVFIIIKRLFLFYLPGLYCSMGRNGSRKTY